MCCVLCPPFLKAELPPPYTAIASPDAGGVPVINCRVCQSLINLDGKLHQHVVKCTVCNEATVSGEHCWGGWWVYRWSWVQTSLTSLSCNCHVEWKHLVFCFIWTTSSPLLFSPILLPLFSVVVQHHNSLLHVTWMCLNLCNWEFGLLLEECMDNEIRNSPVGNGISI